MIPFDYATTLCSFPERSRCVINTAILTDLDGTLFDSHGVVSPSNRGAIADYISSGGIFAIATGREPQNARRHLPDLPINGPSIVLNGAAVYDFASHRYLTTVLMDKETGSQVVASCLENKWKLDIQVYTTDGIFYATPIETADPGYLRIHQPTSYLPLSQLETLDWIKVVMLEREAGALATMRDYLKQVGFEHRVALVEGTTDVVKIGKYVELLPPGINKGTAVSFLRELPEYEGRTIYAIGDYWNDIELLNAADVACCPTNAIDEVKAVCKHIVASHNDGAIADLVRRVIFNQSAVE